MRDEATMKPNFSTQGTGTPGLLGKLLAFILSAALFVLALMFSLAALAVVAVVGTLFAGWLWWKTRALRKQMQAAGGSAYQGGSIIEGQAVRTTDAPSPSDKLLS